jgi:hypothetical protein
MTVPIDKNRCTYLTEKGNRCRNTRWSDSDLCMFHHDYLKRASPRNALNIQVAQMDLDNPEGVHKLLSETMRGLVQGQISPRRATSIGYFGQILLVSLDRLESYRRRSNVNNEWNTVKQKALTDLILDRGINVVDGEPQDKNDEAPAHPAEKEGRDSSAA